MDPDNYGQHQRSGWRNPGEYQDDEYDEGGGLARHTSHQRSEEWQPPGGWNLGRGKVDGYLPSEMATRTNMGHFYISARGNMPGSVRGRQASH